MRVKIHLALRLQLLKVTQDHRFNNIALVNVTPVMTFVFSLN